MNSVDAITKPTKRPTFDGYGDLWDALADAVARGEAIEGMSVANAIRHLTLELFEARRELARTREAERCVKSTKT